MVHRDNVTVRINKTEAVKNGKTYVNFVVNHYEKGRRWQYSFAEAAEARAKADEVADAIVGQ